MIKKLNVRVNNLPQGTIEPWVVATVVDGDLWFWGAYPTRERAEAVLEVRNLTIPSIICEVEECF